MAEYLRLQIKFGCNVLLNQDIASSTAKDNLLGQKAAGDAGQQSAGANVGGRT